MGNLNIFQLTIKWKKNREICTAKTVRSDQFLPHTKGAGGPTSPDGETEDPVCPMLSAWHCALSRAHRYWSANIVDFQFMLMNKVTLLLKAFNSSLCFTD